MPGHGRMALFLIAAGTVTGMARPCELPENLVPSCALTSDVEGWLDFSGGLTHVPTDGSPGLGCAESLSGCAFRCLAFFSSAKRCIQGVSAGQSYGYGLRLRLASGVAFDCGVRLYFHESPDCTTGQIFVTASIPGGAPSTSWTQLQGLVTAPEGAQSAMLDVACTSGVPFSLRFDSVFFGPGMTPVELSSFEID